MVFGGISRVDDNETFVHGGSDERAGCRFNYCVSIVATQNSQARSSVA